MSATVRSWLATGSPSPAGDELISFPHDQLKLPSSPTLFATHISSCSEIHTNSSASQETSCSSSRSNHSIQSLISIPSLQTTSSISVSYHYVSSLKPQTQHGISCLAVSGDLLYAATGNKVHVFTLTNSQHINTFNDKDSSSGFVKSVTFGEGKVFTAHQDCKIRIWLITPTKHHQLVATLPTVNDRLRRLILPKNYVRVRRHKKRLWIEHADAVSGLSVTEGLLYSVSWDKSLKIWRTSNLRCLESVKVHEDAVNAVAVSVDGTVYTASADKRIKVWGPVSGRQQQKQKHHLIATLEKHKSAVNALALSSDGSTLFSGAGDRSILVWEREEDSENHMNVTGALRGHKGSILCLINVSDVLVSGSEDRKVRVWRQCENQRYDCISVLEGHVRPVKSLVAVVEEPITTVSPASVTTISVYSGCLDGEIRVWQVIFSTSGCHQTNTNLDSSNSESF